MVDYGYLYGFPDEVSHFDVSAPFCDDFGHSSLFLPVSVEYADDSVVGFVACSAVDVDGDDVSVVCHFDVVGHVPDFEVSVVALL